ncbi:urease accessory protein UreE [Rhodopseudomonas sp. WA056]|uniref:urease accessory protein UreE n=1 Tax=Rhodopseudomonas sp. WA056 TaxID=2269367 RepID=UPI0013DEB765|nr:urease accessory protein UreE [Rhodopseudomonas sp. WA056]NEW89118.1 urease accessory protein UreE [Rhodopseudomonas sp. WA056]
MIRATAVRGQHRWTETPADTVVLDFDDRHRRRMAMTGTRGLAFLLDLEQAVALRGGDALVLDDGRLVEVVAAPEPLLEIRGHDPQHLVRLAWHLGNRHLPTQLMAKALRIRRDHVIADMVRGLGGKVVEIEAPFDPEGGAYAPAHDSGEAAHAHHDQGQHDHAHHDHHHGHGHHDHGHHGHAHHDHDHADGGCCGHDHHGHDHHVHDEHCGHSHKHEH